MALYDVFHKAADTIFKVFKSLQHIVQYRQVNDDGWGNISTVTRDKIELIIDSFTLEDIQTLPFGTDIQPADMKGLVKGKQLLDLTIKIEDVFIDENGAKWNIVGFTTDPASALYIFLLRR